jgi:hypothetical protein
LGPDTDWNLYDPFSLYANASRVFPLERFREMVRETMAFVDRYNLQSDGVSSTISKSKKA